MHFEQVSWWQKVASKPCFKEHSVWACVCSLQAQSNMVTTIELNSIGVA
jgi:hypothetical protein